MADIQKYLDDIKSAVYGEEVRGSIHDAIKAIDEEVVIGGIKNIEMDPATWDSDKKSSRWYRFAAKITIENAQNIIIPFSFGMNTADSQKTVAPSYFRYQPESAILEGWLTLYNSNSVRLDCFNFNHLETDHYSTINFLVPETFSPGETVSIYIMIPEYFCTNSMKGYLFDISVSDNAKFEPLWDNNEYISSPYYENYFLRLPELAYYPHNTVTSEKDGLVPKATVANTMFATFQGNPKWATPKEFGLITPTEVDTKIAKAITEANVPQFVELDHIPTVEEAEPNKFYLVKNEDTGHYDIYALLGEKVELIDDTTIDLSNYTTLTDEQYNALIQLLGEE